VKLNSGTQQLPELWNSRHTVSEQKEGYVSIVFRIHKTLGDVELKAIKVPKDSHIVNFFTWRFTENQTTCGGSMEKIQGEVDQVSISPNLMLIATSEAEGTKNLTIKLRDSDGDIKQTLNCNGLIQSLVFSNNGSLLASAEKVGHGDTMIKLWDTETGELKRQVEAKLSTGALAFSPGDSLLACGCSKEGKINIWGVASGKLKQTFPGDRNAGVTSLIFNDTGNLLASGGISSEIIKIWNMATDKLYQTLDNEGPVAALAFSHDGRLLASGDAKKGVIKIWARPKE